MPGPTSPVLVRVCPSSLVYLLLSDARYKRGELPALAASLVLASTLGGGNLDGPYATPDAAFEGKREKKGGGVQKLGRLFGGMPARQRGGNIKQNVCA